MRLRATVGRIFGLQRRGLNLNGATGLALFGPVLCERLQQRRWQRFLVHPRRIVKIEIYWPRLCRELCHHQH